MTAILQRPVARFEGLLAALLRFRPEAAPAEDWAGFIEDLRAVGPERRRPENRWGIVLHSTSCRAMPATPAATWPMSYDNYRGRVCRYLRARQHIGQLFYEGRNLWAVESLGTESLATHILDA